MKETAVTVAAVTVAAVTVAVAVAATAIAATAVAATAAVATVAAAAVSTADAAAAAAAAAAASPMQGRGEARCLRRERQGEQQGDPRAVAHATWPAVPREAQSTRQRQQPLLVGTIGAAVAVAVASGANSAVAGAGGLRRVRAVLADVDAGTRAPGVCGDGGGAARRAAGGGSGACCGGGARGARGARGVRARVDSVEVMAGKGASEAVARVAEAEAWVAAAG
eukprot:1647086-Prymnesium_polylepis.1